MNTTRLLFALVLMGAVLLAGCGSGARVGALRSESQSVELGDASPVRVEINLGAGDLNLTGGAEKLLEADFNYNVARLKPEVKYADGALVVRQPNVKGLPALRNIKDFHNAWGLRLYEGVPLDLNVNMGAGTSDLQLAGLSLTQLDVNLGAGISTIDLSGDWDHNLNVAIDTGATDITVRLPREVGARIAVKSGPHAIEAPGLEQDGNIYTNAAYGVSDVTLNVNMESGIGRITLEVEQASAVQN